MSTGMLDVGALFGGGGASEKGAHQENVPDRAPDHSPDRVVARPAGAGAGTLAMRRGKSGTRPMSAPVAQPGAGGGMGGGFVMSSERLRDVDGSALTIPKPYMAVFSMDERGQVEDQPEPESRKATDEGVADEMAALSALDGVMDGLNALDGMGEVGGLEAGDMIALFAQPDAGAAAMAGTSADHDVQARDAGGVTRVDLDEAVRSAQETAREEQLRQDRASRAAMNVSSLFGGGAAALPKAEKAVEKEKAADKVVDKSAPVTPAAMAAPIMPPPRQDRSKGKLGAASMFRSSEVDMRRMLSSAKTLAPLVMAVSQTADLRSSPSARGKILGELMSHAYEASIQVAETISTLFDRDVDSSMVATLMQVMAHDIGERWRLHGDFNAENYCRDFMEAYQSNQEFLARSVSFMGDLAYRPVKSDRTVAEDRLAVSGVNAAWTLHGHVQDRRLLLDENRFPGVYFSFGQKPDVLVSRMLESCMNEVAGLRVDVKDVDHRISHMQSSLSRLSDMMGTEYARQALQTLAWVQAAPDEATRQAREQEAGARFDEVVYPRIVEWSRVNFLNIERSAGAVLEKVDTREYLARSHRPG